MPIGSGRGLRHSAFLTVMAQWLLLGWPPICKNGPTSQENEQKKNAVNGNSFLNVCCVPSSRVPPEPLALGHHGPRLDLLGPQLQSCLPECFSSNGSSVGQRARVLPVGWRCRVGWACLEVEASFCACVYDLLPGWPWERERELLEQKRERRQSP